MHATDTDSAANSEAVSMEHVLTVLLAGGAGERLHPLTRHRAKPAVPFGGMYRIIDFTLSNCVNSHCRRIQVLVQYKSSSLARHIRSAWNIMHTELGEFIDIIPPQMRINDNWYLGTADALYQNLYSIHQEDPREVLILSGDHIYKMDYKKLVADHRRREADLTIATIEVPVDQAQRLGIIQVDQDMRIAGFEEKPKHPQTVPGKDGVALASMGIYIFNTEVLKDVVVADAESETSSHDFGKDILPKMLDKYRVFAHTFIDENKKETTYWRDVGTIESYWEANMDLVSVDPQFNLYDQTWPLRTNLPMHPPAKFVFAAIGKRFGVATDSIVSPGCIVSGGMVSRSVLASLVRVNSYAYVEESILMDRCSIGRHSRIRRAIIEKDIRLPDNTTIGYNLDEDAKRYRVTPTGIVVVEEPAV